jgi:hypothetical protein
VLSGFRCTDTRCAYMVCSLVVMAKGAFQITDLNPDDPKTLSVH